MELLGHAHSVGRHGNGTHEPASAVVGSLL